MASKKRGLSIEEKRQRLLELITEKKEVFQLKELEKLAPKEKGVIAQSVKEVLQSLVDDGLVETDKIGTLTCFWSFPAKALQNRGRRLKDLDNQLETLRASKAQLDEAITREQVGKEDSNERTKLLTVLAQLKCDRSQLDERVATLESNDPLALEEMTKDMEGERERANRWTDNIFSVRTWVKNRCSVDLSDIDKQFGIPDDLDYVE